MGIDHIVDLDCSPKRALGVESIVNLLKSQSRADAVVEIARRNGDQRPIDQIMFKVAVQRPTGTEVTDVSVAQLYAQASELDPHRAACAQCPANAGSQAGFGCTSYITYPIEQATEQWLWSRLPSDLNTTAGHFLQRAINDFGWDGAPVAQMRQQGDTFFEAKTPLTGRYPSGFAISSDQLLHLMFHVGHLNATHAFMVVLFLGVVPHTIDPAIVGDDARRAQVLSMVNLPRAPGQIGELAGFLRACANAARMSVDVLIDG